MVLGKLEILCSKMKLNFYILPCIKLNSKCIKNLGIIPETLYLTDEKVGPNHHVRLGPDFLNKTLKA